MTAPSADRSLLTADPAAVTATWAFAHRWFGPIVRWAWGFASRNPERVPEGPSIIAANHISNIDPFLLGFAMPRPGGMMGKAEVFRIPGLAWVLRRFGGFPVQRGARDEGAVATAQAILTAGWPLILFPEGTRNPTGRWGASRIRSGAARIALATRVPIVPAAIVGTQQILPKGAWWPRRVQAETRFGPPLYPETYLPPSDWPIEQQLAHISTQIVLAIAKLLPDELVDLPQTPV